MTEHNRSQRTVSTPKAVSEETLLKAAKEITVKFIEVGRVTPATFDATFKTIYATLKESTTNES